MKMCLYDIVKKLTGPICPAGDSSVDEERYNNLKNLIYLVETLVFDIERVSDLKNSYEFSVSKAGKLAHGFLTELQTDEQVAERDHLKEVNADLLEALEWYESKTSLVNRHDSEGDAVRDALAKDYGQKARDAITKARV